MLIVELPTPLVEPVLLDVLQLYYWKNNSFIHFLKVKNIFVQTRTSFTSFKNNFQISLDHFIKLKVDRNVLQHCYFLIKVFFKCSYLKPGEVNKGFWDVEDEDNGDDDDDEDDDNDDGDGEDWGEDECVEE